MGINPYKTLEEFNNYYSGVNAEYIIIGPKKEEVDNSEFINVKVSFNMDGKREEYIQSYPKELNNLTLESLIVGDLIIIL